MLWKVCSAEPVGQNEVLKARTKEKENISLPDMEYDTMQMNIRNEKQLNPLPTISVRI